MGSPSFPWQASILKNNWHYLPPFLISQSLLESSLWLQTLPFHGNHSDHIHHQQSYCQLQGAFSITCLNTHPDFKRLATPTIFTTYLFGFAWCTSSLALLLLCDCWNLLLHQPFSCSSVYNGGIHPLSPLILYPFLTNIVNSHGFNWYLAIDIFQMFISNQDYHLRYKTSKGQK